MAFFKLHKGAHPARAAARSAPSALGSVETLRRRARHRLIGATILVALGVAGLPRLFDSEPRPLPVNVPITIIHPQRVPVPAPIPTVPTAPPSSAMIVENEEGTREIPTRPARAMAATANGSGDIPPTRPVLSLPSPKVRNKDKNKSKSKSEPEPAAAADKSDKSDKSPKPYIVHVGAFSNFSKAHAVRLKVEATGLKTYTQIIERKQEKRVLVRIGPMKSRTEADAAAARVRKLDLSASVLERER